MSTPEEKLALLDFQRVEQFFGSLQLDEGLTDDEDDPPEPLAFFKGRQVVRDPPPHPYVPVQREAGVSRNNRRARTEEKRRARDIKKGDDLLRKKVDGAKKNLVRLEHVDLADLVAAKRDPSRRLAAARPPAPPEILLWDDPHTARMAVDANGVAVLLVIPGFLTPQHNTSLGDPLVELGRSENVKPRVPKYGVRTRGRDTGYIRKHVADECSGSLQLVPLWKALGHPHGPSTPSKDMLRSGRTFMACTDLMKRFDFVESRINAVLEALDKPAYDAYVESHRILCSKHAAYKALSGLDGCLFHGRSLIYNRQTPYHFDTADPAEAWTPLLALGSFEGGEIYWAELGIMARFGPGTLVLGRGGVLGHEIAPFFGGQRICVAHFMHDDVQKDTGITLPVSALYAK